MATKKKAGKSVGTVNVRAEKVNVSGDRVSPSKWVPPHERKSGWEEYELREAMRTLSEAKKIRKNPALMRALRKEATRQLQALQATKNELGA